MCFARMRMTWTACPAQRRRWMALPESERAGSGATKAAATGGGSTVWSSGLCRPDTSLASVLLHAMPAEVRKPAALLMSARASAAT